MTTIIHSFDSQGYYVGSSPVPVHPITGREAVINVEVATADPLLSFDPETQRLRRVDGAWAVEDIPRPDPEPAPDSGTPTHACSKLQGELVLLQEPSPTPEHPTLLHWVEAAVDAESDPIRKRTMLAYLNAPTWRSDDPLVPTMWQAAGRDLAELPALFTKAQGL